MAEQLEESAAGLESITVGIYRTAAVVKGGRRFSFGALVAVGDRDGNVGVGYGKAPSVPAAIEKAQKDGRKHMAMVLLQDGTIPHPLTARFGASLVKLVPAAPGTGVIAGATVRAVLELAGVRDCLTKSFGSNNQKNLAKATLEGLKLLRRKEHISSLRGVPITSTEVEERIEAGRKFAPKIVAGEKMRGPVNVVGQKNTGRGRGRSRGRGRGGPRPAPEAAAAPPATESGATAAPDKSRSGVTETVSKTPNADSERQTPASK